MLSRHRRIRSPFTECLYEDSGNLSREVILVACGVHGASPLDLDFFPCLSTRLRRLWFLRSSEVSMLLTE